MRLTFNDTATAFAYKDDAALKTGRFLFGTMNYNWFASVGVRVTPFLMKTGLPIHGLIRKTIFKQFVGGETLEETTRVAELLSNYKVDVILDYGVEGKEGESNFDNATEEFIRVINYAATQPNIPFISVKVTGIARFALLEKLHAAPRLRSGIHDDEVDKEEWERVANRLRKICAVASAKNIGVLIDAEESWIQDPIDRLTTNMMQEYNKSKACIFNTFQLYRNDRLQFLKMSHRIARQQKFILGAKLVRGAYMEKERGRAEELQYTSPIQQDKSFTDGDFNGAVEYCLNDLENISVIVASHNEYSNLAAAEKLHAMNIPHNHPNIHFSQLYGMSDNITFNLAAAGYNVSKYLPFGPIRDVIPYLMRRAQENSSLNGQTNRELLLIRSELRRREKLRKKS